MHEFASTPTLCLRPEQRQCFSSEIYASQRQTGLCPTSHNLREPQARVSLMTCCCFAHSTGDSLRRIQKAVGRRVFATEMVGSESTRSPSVSWNAKRNTVAVDDGSEHHHRNDSLASPNTIPIMYLPPQPKRAQRLRSDANRPVSILPDSPDLHFHIPTAPSRVTNKFEFRDSLFDESPTGTVLHHSKRSRSFQSPSESIHISSPLTQHHLFARKPEPNRKPSTTHQDSSRYLERRCSQLYGEREKLADYLQAALRDLSGARQQLESAKNGLAVQEEEVHRLNVQAASLAKGMVSPVDQSRRLFVY